MRSSIIQPQSNQSVLELHLRIAVEAGNGIFRGIQPAFRSNGKVVEALCLFDSKTTGTTLALKVSQVSEAAVRKQIADSDALFESYAEKAAGFVLRHFARRAA